MLVEDKNKVFGIRLKNLRLNKGLNQQSMADKINISRARYSHYENNHVEPDMDLINKFADFHNVSVDYLLGRTDNPYNEKEFDPLAEHNRLLKKYGIEDSGFFDIEKWKQMGPEEIRQLEEYFEFIVGKAKERNKDSE